MRHVAEARVTEWLHGLGSARHQLVAVDRQPTPVVDNGTVYAMGYADRVKVGWTGRTTGWRLRQMQPFYPETLIVFGSCPGTRGDEARFHGLFRLHQIRGEWFLREGAVAAWIEAGCPVQSDPAQPA